MVIFFPPFQHVCLCARLSVENTNAGHAVYLAPFFFLSHLIHLADLAVRHLVLVTQSCLTLCDPVVCSLTGSSLPWNSPVKKTRVGCHFLLQGIFPAQGSNLGLLHCRQILYHPLQTDSLPSEPSAHVNVCCSQPFPPTNRAVV